ncbi:uncharacterized protein LOC144590759 [Rhinoraja longicauda]
MKGGDSINVGKAMIAAQWLADPNSKHPRKSSRLHAKWIPLYQRVVERGSRDCRAVSLPWMRSRLSSEAAGAAATRLQLGPHGCRHRELRQLQRVRPPQIAGLGSAHRGPYTVRRGLERGSFNSLTAGEDIRGRGKTSWPSITVRSLPPAMHLGPPGSVVRRAHGPDSPPAALAACGCCGSGCDSSPEAPARAAWTSVARRPLGRGRHRELQQRQRQRVRPPRIAGLGSAPRGPFTVRRGLQYREPRPPRRGNSNSLTSGEDGREEKRHSGLPSQ